MKKSLASLIGKKERRYAKPLDIQWFLPEQLMGIEVEVDRDSISTTYLPTTHTGWTRKTDGSLRNGVEYVLDTPMAGKQLLAAVQSLFIEGQFTRQATASTHIHLDMLEENTPASTVQSIFLLCYLLEDAIFALGDPGREWCGYTNKLTTASKSILTYFLQDNIEDDEDNNISTTCSGMGRYYGLNLQALAKFGSLEFRYFPTATSAQELADWVQLVQSFKVVALQYPTLAELLEVFADEGTYQSFLRNNFAQWQDWFFKTCPYSKVKRDLNYALAFANVRAANELAYADQPDFRAVIRSTKFSKLIKRKKSPQELPASGPEPVMMHGYRVNPQSRQEADRTMQDISRAYTLSQDTQERTRLQNAYSTIQAIRDGLPNRTAAQFVIPEVTAPPRTVQRPATADRNINTVEDIVIAHFASSNGEF